MEADERRRAAQLDEIRTLIGPLCVDPVDGVRRLLTRVAELEAAPSVCVCCKAMIEPREPLCENCAGSFTHYIDGINYCDRHQPEEGEE